MNKYTTMRECLMRDIHDLEDQRDFAMSEVERRGCERDKARDMVLRLRKQRAIARNFGQQMERERDEAREAAAKWESSSDAMERAGAEQARRADENREWAVSAELERDEAREAFAIATNNCTGAQQSLRQARDRAWKLACERSRWKLDCLEQCKLLAMSADREEKLRAEIAGWENRWQCAVELAALAKVKLHDAKEALK